VDVLGHSTAGCAQNLPEVFFLSFPLLLRIKLVELFSAPTPFPPFHPYLPTKELLDANNGDGGTTTFHTRPPSCFQVDPKGCIASNTSIGLIYPLRYT